MIARSAGPDPPDLTACSGYEVAVPHDPADRRQQLAVCHPRKTYVQKDNRRSLKRSSCSYCCIVTKRRFDAKTQAAEDWLQIEDQIGVRIDQQHYRISRCRALSDGNSSERQFSFLLLTHIGGN